MKTLLLTFITVASISITANAQDVPLRKKHFNLEQGVAIQGYDPVDYFQQNKGVKGRKELSLSYQGATYYFANAANKEEFKKNAAKYEPEFGGWCAYAMGSNGTKVEVDPETFKIVDGKLYLFYNKFFNNTLKSWNKNEAQLKSNAVKNWTGIYR